MYKQVENTYWNYLVLTHNRVQKRALVLVAVNVLVMLLELVGCSVAERNS